MQIVRREAHGETMRLVINCAKRQNLFFDAILRPFGGGREKFAGERAT